ncbi:MAG: class I SAM-dependent methyltransferase [Raineya sp.]|nr:class I SAM-dependent methyltransferase [Raineya sp.]MDW8295439.1 class I SAM-dependent methyltransferase [Raineya sp.]
MERNYPSQDERIALITSWQEQKKIPTINYFLHLRLFNLALPIIKPQDSWLTVGDGYGFDAHFLKEQGCKVTASDISTTFLELSQNAGLIENYSAENAEKLSFADNTFDFVFCKEAFHHFPKPFVAVYEMLRVAKKGIILIEPQDPISRMPLLLALRNILDNIQTNLLEKIWKNRYSFEPVGNYVFKLSERECEKIAMGLFLPAIAFKGIQNNYYQKDISNVPATKKSKVFQKMNFKIFRDTLLARLGILPYQILSAIIFKQMPDQATIKKLKEAQYRFYVLPPNPYLQSNS